MPPKFKFTKEEIILCALNITRENGIEALTARSLAERLGTSTKPIFGLFKNMEDVRAGVINEAYKKYHGCLQKTISEEKYPVYKASGMGYIQFAKEEKELFKLLFMRDRSNEKIDDNREEVRPQLEMIKDSLNLSEDDAWLFHIEMWIYVHGIATMTATAYLEWETEFISNTLSDVYNGLRQRFLEKSDSK